MAFLVDETILISVNNKLNNRWLEGDYQPPYLLLAYEPIFEAWYLVVDDTTPIIELTDEEGSIYTVLRQNCSIERHGKAGGIYICSNVDRIRDFPMTDRQYFVNESLVPLLDDNYNLV